MRIGYEFLAHIGNPLTRAGDDIEYAGRQTGLFKDLCEKDAAAHGRFLGRLEHDGIPHRQGDGKAAG